MKVPTLVTLVFAVIFIFYASLYPDTFPIWTGFGPYDEEVQGPRSKTLWDWLELLIVPAFIAFAVWLLNANENKSRMKVESDRQNQEKLDKYFDSISNFLTERDLRDNIEVQRDARDLTLSVLRQLDGKRKVEVLQFIKDRGLIENNEDSERDTIIDLTGADLRKLDFTGSVLRVSFQSPALYYVKIRDGADFSDSKMHGIDIHGSFLYNSAFVGADLRRIKFKGADLSYSCLNRANLRGSDFRGANIRCIDISNASLWGAIFDNDQQDYFIGLSAWQKIVLKMSLVYLNFLTFFNRFFSFCKRIIFNVRFRWLKNI